MANNKTYMAKPGEVESKWYVIDATGMVLGRLASQVASILKGKNKPEYTSKSITPMLPKPINNLFNALINKRIVAFYVKLVQNIISNPTNPCSRRF